MSIVKRLVPLPTAAGFTSHVWKALVAPAMVGVVVIGPQQPVSADTGTQIFHITYAGPFDPPTLPTRRVTAHGVIQAEGHEQVLGEGPGPEPGTFQVSAGLVFPEGRVFFTATVTGTFRFNAHACKGFTRPTGVWVITGGTGAYSGATGEGTIKGQNILSGDKSADGCPEQADRMISNLRLTGTSTLAEA